MRVIKQRQIVEDAWQLLADEQPAEDAADVVVSVERWNRDREQLTRRSGKTGVVLRSAGTPQEIESLHELALVAVDFPKFVDGRGYSHARLLRERLGFRGELRAVGNVLRDQLFYMQRCGIDSFALQEGKDIEAALDAFSDFDVTYQAAADDPRPLFRRVAR